MRKETLAREVDLQALESVALRPVEFLWNPYLPKGRVTILEGDPGLGKTWLCLEIAARLSTGERLSGCRSEAESLPEPARVLFLNGEDDAADTLRPRLEAAGADLSRVLLVSGIREPSTGRTALFDLQRLGHLEAVIQEYRPALFVVDPVQAFLGPRVSLNSPSQVRALLAPLSALAHQSGCAFLLVRHLVKYRSGPAVHQGMGATELSAAVRSILRVGREGGSGGRRALTHVKSSTTTGGESLYFALRDGRLVFEESAPLSAADLDGKEPTAEERTALEEAIRFLEEFIPEGRCGAATEVVRMARMQGVATRTLTRARRALQMETKRNGKYFTWHRPPAGGAQRAPAPLAGDRPEPPGKPAVPAAQTAYIIELEPAVAAQFRQSPDALWGNKAAADLMRQARKGLSGTTLTLDLALWEQLNALGALPDLPPVTRSFVRQVLEAARAGNGIG